MELRRKIIPTGGSHRVTSLRLLANGVLITTGVGETAEHKHVLHAWLISAADLSCTMRWGSELTAASAPLVVHDANDGGFVATSDAAGIRVWDLATGVLVSDLRLPNVVLHAASAQRLWLSIRGADGGTTIVVLSTTGIPQNQIAGGEAGIQVTVERITPFLDERAAAVLRSPGRRSVHVVGRAFVPPREIPLRESPYNAMALLANGRLFIMLPSGPVVVDAENGAEIFTIEKRGLSEAHSCVVSPGGRLVATIHGGLPGERWVEDASVHIWDLSARAHLHHRILGAESWPDAAIFIDDRRLLLARGDQELCLWSLDVVAPPEQTFDDLIQELITLSKKYVVFDRLISSYAVAEDHDPSFSEADRDRLHAAYPARAAHARSLLAVFARLDQEHHDAWRSFLATSERRLRALDASKETDRHAAGHALYNWASWASGKAGDEGRFADGMMTLKKNAALIDQLLRAGG